MPGDAFWALSSRLLRTRTESQQMMEAVDALLREQGRESVHVEMLPMGEDWHVVGWPFKTRADADRARAGLLARGLHVDVIDF